MSYNNSGSHFISGGGDDLCLLWEVAKSDGKIEPEKKEESNEEEKEKDFEDCEKNVPVYVFPKNEETVEFVSFNKDDDLVAMGCLDGTLKVYFLKDKNYSLKCKLEGPTEEIRVLFFFFKKKSLLHGTLRRTYY